MTKRSIKHDLLIQLGFFVYQYAELRMLSFYHDVIDRFVDRSDYCILFLEGTPALIVDILIESSVTIGPGVLKWLGGTDEKESFDIPSPIILICENSHE